MYTAEYLYLYKTIADYQYRNDPMFSDTWVWVNSADPDQTAPLAV